MSRIFVICLFLPMLAFAGPVEDLKQFLATTRTLRADFSQLVVGKSGRKAQQSYGVVSLSRPGKLRWELTRPYAQLIVGNGQKFWIYDPDLAQVTIKKADQALSGSPAALLAGDNALEREFTLRSLGDSEGLSWIEAVPNNAESGFAKVRLGMQGTLLRAMELHDHFAQVTHLRFSGMERNLALPASLFTFVPPPGADVVGE